MSALAGFDLTDEDRQEMQLIQAELDLRPERLKPAIAELVLARKLARWACRHRDRLPPALRQVCDVLARRSNIRAIAADSRAELEEEPR